VRTVVNEKYVLEEKEIDVLLSKLAAMNYEVLMQERIISRAVLEISPDPRRSNAPQWVRVREGDIDIHHKNLCTLTYKSVEHIGQRKVERLLEMNVQDFEECIEFLILIELKLVSRQQNRRTKLIIETYSGFFVVSLDTWPWMEDICFVGISPIRGSTNMELEEFCKTLDLTDDLRLQKKARGGGIDGISYDRLGFSLSDVSNVRFGINVPKKGRKDFTEHNGRKFTPKPPKPPRPPKSRRS